MCEKSVSEEITNLPDGYSVEAIAKIIELAKDAVACDYGKVHLPPIVIEKLFEECRNLIKKYNNVVAYEEIKQSIIEYIKV